MTTEPRIKTENLPVSREIMLAKFKRELAEMTEYLATFHNELLNDHKDATIMYPRIMIGQAHEGAEQALIYLDRLDEFLGKEGVGLTEIAEKAKS